MRYKNSILSLSLSTILFSYSAPAFQFDLDFQHGRFEASAQYWQTLLDQTTDKTKQIEAKIGLAFAYQKLGFYQKSALLLENALKDSPDEINKIWIYIGLSDSLNASSQQSKARRQYLAQAEKLARHLHQLHLLAEVLKRKGNWLNILRKTDEARAVYEESLTLAEQTDNSHLAVEILINLTQLSREEDDFKKAIQAIQRLEPSFTKSFGFINLSKLADNVFSSPPEKQYFIKESLKYAIESANKIKDWRNLSYAHGLLGEYYATKEQNDELTLKEFRQALFFAQQDNLITPLSEIEKCKKTGERLKVLPLPEFTYRWYWKLGRLFKRQQKIEMALGHYRQAVQQLRFVRFSLSNRHSSDFGKDIAPVYLEFADLLTEKALNLRDSKVQQEFLQEAKEMLEQLAEQELRNYLQIDNCEELYVKEKEKTCKPMKESEIVKVTAVLYSIFQSKESLKFLLQFDNNLYPINVSKEALGKIGSFHKKCANNQEECKSLGKTLYFYLIEPLEEKLQNHGVETVIIVPNGDLKKIPFSALYNEKEGKYFIEQYQLIFTQGMNTTDRDLCGRKEKQIFLGGVSESVQGFNKLPRVKNELEEIRGIFSENTIEVLLNEDFNKNSIKNTIQRLTPENPFLLHFATHAKFGSTLEATFFLTFDGEFSSADFEEVFKKKEKYPELITLSACQTAMGNDRVFLGLAGMAVKFGAQSALGSLWEVDDKSTSQLMPAFYEALKNEEISKSVALQQAQVQLLHNPDYQHPYYWAPFILIGNSQ